MGAVRAYRLAEVFAVGKEPTVTYSPRDEKRLEAIVGDYLEERGRVLVVTGPSKSGKTVLLRRTVPGAIWLSGGQIASVDNFWRQVVDQAGGWTGETKALSRTDTEGTRSATSAQFKPVGVGAETQLGDEATVSDTSSHERTVDRNPQSVGIGILTDSREPLVLDDFHHMPPPLQRDIVRQLKPLVERELGVIFAAVPHHAADAVMAENEMEARVETLRIGLWDRGELMEIADRGFRGALRVDISDELAAELARHSFRSPHLMQLLCRELSKASGIRESVGTATRLAPPSDWEVFLADVAGRYTDDRGYSDLVRGPQSRKDRAQRTLKEGGGTTDIYGAVMAAIRETGPAERLSYNGLRDALREVLEDLPQKEQITNPLKHMTMIAHRRAQDEFGRMSRDPVLEWRPEDEMLHVVDPFFAFRVRFGAQMYAASSRETPPVLTEASPVLREES